ncbi:snare-like protein [Clathrospora elynae]|uniref:Synaptobrevin homolog YKT6 n=1 Tax=Clathrospora elynae TaxID=706981 RepID=A0A6A5T526_9PLEO|nr:snare-like protein [Clathrospora elynae]
MKIVYIGIIKNEGKSVELSAERALAGFNYFTRGSIGEFLSFSAETIAGRTLPGQRQSVKDKDTDYMFHAYARSEGVCGIIATDQEYPNKVAHQLLSKIVDEFTSKYPRTAYANAEAKAAANKDSAKLPFPELANYIVKYQDPQEADSVMKIQKELDETKIVLHDTIQSVLARGEKIDDLVAKSDGLSAQSKMFYTQAKKQNSCCTVM